MTIKGLMRASRALALAVFAACAISGCDKEPVSTPIDPASPESYMKDEAFQNRLREIDKEKREIYGRFQAVQKELAAAKASAPEKVKELEEKLKALEEEHQANRRKMQAVVRERLTKKNLKQNK